MYRYRSILAHAEHTRTCNTNEKTVAWSFKIGISCKYENREKIEPGISIFHFWACPWSVLFFSSPRPFFVVLSHSNVGARAHGLSVGNVGNVVKLPSVSRVFLFCFLWAVYTSPKGVVYAITFSSKPSNTVRGSEEVESRLKLKCYLVRNNCYHEFCLLNRFSITFSYIFSRLCQEPRWDTLYPVLPLTFRCWSDFTMIVLLSSLFYILFLFLFKGKTVVRIEPATSRFIISHPVCDAIVRK